MCINFTNESLHNLFIEHVFKLEQEVYVREEVEWSFVSYEDNQHVLDLISKRPVCVLGLLDEGSSTGAGKDSSFKVGSGVNRMVDISRPGSFAIGKAGPTRKYCDLTKFYATPEVPPPPAGVKPKDVDLKKPGPHVCPVVWCMFPCRWPRRVVLHCCW